PIDAPRTRSTCRDGRRCFEQSDRPSARYFIPHRQVSCRCVMQTVGQKRWRRPHNWAGLFAFLTSLVVTSLTGQMTPLPLEVSLANRFLIATYCIWFMAAAGGVAATVTHAQNS